MTDTIIKGAGSSRSIRSVPNLGTLAPTYEKLVELLSSPDGLPIDLGPLSAAGCEQIGTTLDKNALLKDTTAALYGLTAEAVPDEVLAAIKPLITSTVSSAVSNRARVASGHYSGTSDSTNNRSKSISVGFSPRFFFVSGLNSDGTNLQGGLSSSDRIWNLYGSSYSSSGNFFGDVGYLTGSGAQITAGWKLNRAGFTYDYVAIG